MRLRLLALLLISLPAFGQEWTGIIAPNRAIDWTTAGVKGGIINRTTKCGSTIAAYNGNANTINTALANCNNGYVLLGAGTFGLTTGITITNKSNVTLRGSGPDQTKLVFTGDVACVLQEADICVYYDGTNPTGEHSANWTAGYAKGTSTVTLSSTTGLAVGSLLVLDQLNDSNTDNSEIWQCENGPDDSIPGTPLCATEGATGFGRSGRTQMQTVVVTAINGSQVSIHPSVFMPNFRSGQSPGAWWFGTTVSGVGIEDLSVDNTNSPSLFNIQFGGARDCWVKNVRSLKSNRAQVLGYVTTRITVRDSYFYGTLNALNQSYGSETDMSSSWLFENNIYEHITGPMQPGQGNGGTVFAHNFSTDDYYTNPDWMQASAYTHTAGINYTLFEGNDGLSFTADAIHGTAHFVTAFRNNWPGWETGKTVQTIPYHNYAFNRFNNVIGNVLGRGGYHTVYQCVSATTTDTCVGTSSENVSIYMLGFSGNQEYFTGVNNDPLIDNYLMRWGNYDVVNSGVRWVSGEVPSGAAYYPNPVPASTVLPASFYLGKQPWWWTTTWGTPSWPAIGPDVSGGPIGSGTSDLGGHVKKIPARLCWENTAADGANPYKAFNANACYAAQPVRPDRPGGGTVN